MDQAARQRNTDGNISSNFGSGNASANRSNRPSKQNRRQDGFNQQSFASALPNGYMWPPPGYNSHQYRNPAYQKQSNYRYRQPSGAPPQKASAPAALPTTKQPLLLKPANASGSNQKSDQNARRFNKSGKSRAYEIDDEPEGEETEEAFPGQEKDVGNYHASEDISYYQPPSYNDPEDEDDNAAYLATPVICPRDIRCRRCGTAYPSNNKLHEHLRTKCGGRDVTAMAAETGLQKPSSTMINRASSRKLLADTAAGKDTEKPSADDSRNPAADDSGKSFADDSRNPSANASRKPSAADSGKPSADVPIIASDVDFSKDVGTGHGFRGWGYTRMQVALSPTSEAKPVCLDTGAGIILADKQFSKREAPNVPIRTMASPISVRGVGADKYSTSEYAIADVYIPGLDKSGAAVNAKVTREIHLVDNLKAKMLLGTDFIGPEKIDISIPSKTAYIGSCGVTAPLEVRTPRVIVQTPVHARKTTIVPPLTEVTLPVHYTTIPADRDFLFEPEELNLSLYAHLVDSKSKHTIIRNESDNAVHIPRNCRVGRMTELDFPNAFQVYSDDAGEVSDLALKRPSKEHKTGWFKKIIAAAYAATSLLAGNSLPTAAAGTSSPATAPEPSHSSTIQQRKAFHQVGVQLPEACYSSYQPLAFTNLTMPEIPGLPSPETGAPLPPKPPAHVPSEAILSNGITIHRSSDEAVEAFSKLISEYSNIWKDTGYANLPEEHWMKIPLSRTWGIENQARLKYTL